MNCQRCHNTGLVREDGANLGFCDCAVGRVVWDAALARAFNDVALEVGAS